MTIEDTSSISINGSQLFATEAIFNGIIGIDLNGLDEGESGVLGEAEEVVEAEG